MKIKIKEIKNLLDSGKKIKIKSINDEYTNIISYTSKGIKKTFSVKLENNFEIKVSDDHKFFTNAGWKTTLKLEPNLSKILCEDKSYSIVKSIEYIGMTNIVDLGVDHPDSCYFAKGMLHHNSGKSFLAISVCKNAIDKGFTVVFFDAEGGVESEFLFKVLGKERMNNFIYNQVSFMEEVFETIDSLLVNTNNQYLFVFDSYAACPARAEMEGGFDPSSMYAIGSRVASLGCKKIMMDLKKRNSTLLILNQVRDNIGANKYELAVEPFKIPGGKALAHAYSLRIWLFSYESKAKALMDDDSNKIGKSARALIKKSRFRTEGRECPVQFVWSGDNPRMMDEELWGEALKDRGIIYCKGPVTYIRFKSGEEKIKKLDDWMEQLKEPGFKQKIIELLDESLVYNYMLPGTIPLEKLGLVKDD